MNTFDYNSNLGKDRVHHHDEATFKSRTTSI